VQILQSSGRDYGSTDAGSTTRVRSRGTSERTSDAARASERANRKDVGIDGSRKASTETRAGRGNAEHPNVRNRE